MGARRRGDDSTNLSWPPTPLFSALAVLEKVVLSVLPPFNPTQWMLDQRYVSSRWSDGDNKKRFLSLHLDVTFSTYSMGIQHIDLGEKLRQISKLQTVCLCHAAPCQIICLRYYYMGFQIQRGHLVGSGCEPAGQ